MIIPFIHSIAHMLCICNDNAHCFQNETLTKVHGLHADVRFCVTSVHGFCYATLIPSYSDRIDAADQQINFAEQSDYNHEISSYHSRYSNIFGCFHSFRLSVLICHATENHGVVACCRDSDICNRHLHLHPAQHVLEQFHSNVDLKQEIHQEEKQNKFLPSAEDYLSGPHMLISNDSRPSGESSVVADHETDNGSSSTHLLVFFVTSSIMFLLVAFLVAFLIARCSFYRKSSKFPKHCGKVTSTKELVISKTISGLGESYLSSQWSFTLKESSMPVRVYSDSGHKSQLLHSLDFMQIKSVDGNSEIYEGKTCEWWTILILKSHCRNQEHIIWL